MPAPDDGAPAPRWLAAYPDTVDWHAPLPARPVPEILDRAVTRFGARPCLDFLGHTSTYARLGELVARAAKGLQGLGVRPGTRVGLFLPNTPYFVVCYFAALKCGAVVVNINPLDAEQEIAQQVEDSETDILVTLDLAMLYDKVAHILPRSRLRTVVVGRMSAILPFGKGLLFSLAKRHSVARVPRDDRHVRYESLVANDGRFTPYKADPADLAVLQYTGGTTGQPKGAMLTHANISANVEQTRLWLTAGGRRDDREVVLGVLPLFHVFGMTVLMNTALDIGAELVLLPRFDIDEVARTIHARNVTILPGVPTIFGALINAAKRDRYDLSSLKTGFCGGAPLPADIKDRFEALAGCALVEGYGLTEASPLVACNPVTARHKPGSIGLPVSGTTVEIVSLDDRRTIMAAGQRGEICVRGPQVMQGYWRRPDDTVDALDEDGRLHTGDVGTMDEDGYVFLVDRLKDVILAGGYNVYPRNVEEAIYAHPAVTECVVAGVADPYRGQTVKAYVALRRGESLTLEALNRFLEDKLSPIERPKQLEVRESLPRTMIGKLSRKALLEEEAARAGQQRAAAG